MILLYHGIVEGLEPRERWSVGQAIPAPHFERQLAWLKRNRRVVALSDYLERKGTSNSRSGSLVALTFDDGIGSAFALAWPLLRKYELPATFFLCTSHLNNGPLLWFSYLNALCFENGHPEVAIKGRRLPLRSLVDRRGTRRELGRLAESTGQPAAFARELAERYPLDPVVVQRYSGLSGDQLKVFRGNPLLEVGAHTVSHPYLSRLPREVQRTEILESRATLSSLVGRPVRYFAHPGGDYSSDTLSVLTGEFEAAFATIPKNLGVERFELPRIGIYSPSLLKMKLKAAGVAGAARRLGLRVG